MRVFHENTDYFVISLLSYKVHNWWYHEIIVHFTIICERIIDIDKLL